MNCSNCASPFNQQNLPKQLHCTQAHVICCKCFEQSADGFTFFCQQCKIKTTVKILEDLKTNSYIFGIIKKDDKELAKVLEEIENEKINEINLPEIIQKYVKKFGGDYKRFNDAMRRLGQYQKKLENNWGTTGTCFGWIAKSSVIALKYSEIGQCLEKITWLDQIATGTKRGIMSKSTIICTVAICAVQIVNLLVKWATGQIDSKMLVKLLAIRVVATAGSAVAAAVVGAIGALIGGPLGLVIGSFIGGFIGNFLLEKKLEEWLITELDLKEKQSCDIEKIYLSSLKILELDRNSTDQQVERETKRKIFNSHPDKHVNKPEEDRNIHRQNFIKFLTAHEIVKNYRKQLCKAKISQ